MRFLWFLNKLKISKIPSIWYFFSKNHLWRVFSVVVSRKGAMQIWRDVTLLAIEFLGFSHRKILLKFLENLYFSVKSINQSIAKYKILHECNSKDRIYTQSPFVQSSLRRFWQQNCNLSRCLPQISKVSSWTLHLKMILKF